MSGTTNGKQRDRHDLHILLSLAGTHKPIVMASRLRNQYIVVKRAQ